MSKCAIMRLEVIDTSKILSKKKGDSRENGKIYDKTYQCNKSI